MFQIAVSALSVLIMSLSAAHGADLEIDHTCASCPPRVNDSLIVFHRRAIRVNQVGYLPDKARKVAFAATPAGGDYHILSETGQTVYTGALLKAGDFPKPRMSAFGYANSITLDYRFDSDSGITEAIWQADFSALKTPGRYRVVAGGDTSASFLIHPDAYAKTLEKVLFFFGANRCGANDSWIHAACHLKDGSFLGPAYTGRLAGGWHDCGDYGKYSETAAYTAMILSLGYAIWPGRAPDKFGSSYAIEVPDGVPDLLREAKVGADFIYRLYAVSDELGLIAKADMYHSVGTGPGVDHQSWDVPEKQDAQPASAGGPDRVISAGIGSNVAGSYAASLAFFSSAWKTRDSAYALKLEKAAIDIYDRIVMKRLGTTTRMPCCYPGGGTSHDDEALAALALWYATGDARFGYDLLENTAINKSIGVVNDGEFPAGHMGKRPFGPGGWPTDYENGQIFVLYGLAKLILPDAPTALAHGISETVRDSLLKDIQAALKQDIREGSNGTNASGYPGIQVDEPYHGVFTSEEWGFNRYNMGIVNEIMMYYDLTGNETYAGIGIDNLNYLLGANPYDISFINGCGDRNMQHPHNRAANPEGYNQGGTPYARKVLTGAVMGGVKPGKNLNDRWDVYDNSETCIDFAAQTIFPLLILAPGGGAVVATGKSGKSGKERGPASAAGPQADAGKRKGARDVLGRKAAGNTPASGYLDRFIMRIRAASE
jgi:hypothetical protein